MQKKVSGLLFICGHQTCKNRVTSEASDGAGSAERWDQDASEGRRFLISFLAGVHYAAGGE